MPYAEQTHCVEGNRAQRIEQALLLISHARNRGASSLVHPQQISPKAQTLLCPLQPQHGCGHQHSPTCCHFTSSFLDFLLPMLGLVKANLFQICIQYLLRQNFQWIPEEALEALEQYTSVAFHLLSRAITPSWFLKIFTTSSSIVWSFASIYNLNHLC